MEWIWNLLSRLPTDIQSSVAFPTRASFDDFALPPPKKAKCAASSSRSTLDDLPFQIKGQINDHVYEVVSPQQGRPSIELVFFHGLQLKGSAESQDAHLDTWLSKDGTQLWLYWILGKFPEARILSISYDAHAEQTDKVGQTDMYITTENLVQDLTQAGVGQNKCAVVLVGHCIGGLIMKELCVSATGKVAITRDTLTQPIRNFLDNLKGLFFYATPHFGTNLAEKTNFTKGCLFEDLEPLNKEAARRREQFSTLRQTKGWKTYGMMESEAVTLGKFKGLIVPEASARCDVDECYTAQANHFNICRPHAQNSSSFINLINFIGGLVKETEGQITNQEHVHKCTNLPQYPVGLEMRAHEVQQMLKGGAILGIFGMGGIGKTTLARTVFNNISKDFEYTCFVDNVKGFSINELRKLVLESFYHNGIKLDGAKLQWSQMKGMKALIVMDDTDLEDQLQDLPELQYFESGSCLIVTSRDKEVFKFYENHVLYELEFLGSDEAKKLFCKHAFGSKDVPHHLRESINAVVEKCDGLPLTLEVMGRYLRGKASIAVWEQTLDNLRKALSIRGVRNENDKLWASLKVSYDDLSEEAQETFCDAAMCFFGERLERALASWSCGNPETTWENLVNRALVRVVDATRWCDRLHKYVEFKAVWVHEQLRDLAKKLARDTTLKYVERSAVFVLCEGEDLTPKLRLLKWVGSGDSPAKFKISLINLPALGVLELSRFEFPNEFPEALGNLMNLRILELEYCDVPEGFPYALGNLRNLGILSLRFVNGLERLPESFGNLSRLERLDLEGFDSLTLPKSFGKLLALEDLKFSRINSLELPESLQDLSSLVRLEIRRCSRLAGLPDSFGRHLTSLKKLSITLCPLIKFLPNTFSQLSELQSLSIENCHGLEELGDTFGWLKSLEDLTINCDMLETLPESFGFLKSVRKVSLKCAKLEFLPNSFGELSSVEELEIVCSELKDLPESFGFLKSVRKVSLNCAKLEFLPNSFGELSSAEELEMVLSELEILPNSFGSLKSVRKMQLILCKKLRALPDSFGHLSALEHLEIYKCDELQALPDSFGGLSALRHLEIDSCEEFQSLPESLGLLTNLQYLEIGGGREQRYIGLMEKLPDSLAELTALRYLKIYYISLKSIPESIRNLRSLLTLQLESLPFVKELPPWLGETGITPVAFSPKRFQIQNRKFSFFGDDIGDEHERSLEERGKHVFWMLHKRAMKKVRAADYGGALETLGLDSSGLLLEPQLQGFVLQERGIIKRMMGDLAGALEDLTAALGVFYGGEYLYYWAYDVWKHRGLVNFLLGNLDAAKNDGEMAVTVLPQYVGYSDDLGGEKLGQESVTFMHFLLGKNCEDVISSSHSFVMEQVRAQSDFLSALATWNTLDSVFTIMAGYNRVFFLQERGILKRLANNLHGALEDLTAALEIDRQDHECLKHRGFVKYLLKNLDGARLDAERCLAMGPQLPPGDSCLGEFSVTFMDFNL